MQYSGETNGLDICTLAEKKSKSNSTSFPIADKTLYANMGMKIIWSWIFEVYGGWHYDDSNNTTLPEATTTLKSGQSQYTMPNNSAHLMGVSVKDENGNWYQLKPITLETILSQCAEDEFMDVSGRPEYYRPVANGFKVYPTANWEQDDSIKIHISRDIVSFTITDTTAIPGFVSEFHEAVPTFMALQYCQVNTKPQLQELKLEWDGDENRTGREGGYKKMIKQFYRNRFRQLFPINIINGDIINDYI